MRVRERPLTDTRSLRGDLRAWARTQQGGDLFDAGIYRRGPRRAVSAGSIAVATDARKNAEPSRLPRFAAIEL